jgi:hypothetical protein
LISRIQPENHLHGGTIYLLCPSEADHHGWLCEAETHLVQRGYTVKRCKMGDEIPHRQRVISLVDLNGPFFSKISEQDWMRFQQLILLNPQILWVTNSVELNCANPDFALVMGVSRTARQEQEIQFGTLQVDVFDTFSVEALLNVSDKFFMSIHQTGLVDTDYEFALRDGCIHIPRMKWSSLADRLLQVPDIDAPAKLCVGSYGALDSLSWGEDKLDTLGEYDVDVEIKFVGLNFRVSVRCATGGWYQLTV